MVSGGKGRVGAKCNAASEKMPNFHLHVLLEFNFATCNVNYPNSMPTVSGPEDAAWKVTLV